MPTAKKPTSTSTPSDRAESEAPGTVDALRKRRAKADWSNGTLTQGGGVAATIAQLRNVRGPNKEPTKEQVAIRLDREVLTALRASGPGWQTRVNDALKALLAAGRFQAVQ